MPYEIPFRAVLRTLAFTVPTLTVVSALSGCSPSAASEYTPTSQRVSTQLDDIERRLSAENIIGQPGTTSSAPCSPEESSVLAGATLSYCDVLTIQSGGLSYRAYLFSRRSQQLTIYHEGHNAPGRLGLVDALMPDAHDLLVELLQFSDVLYMDMPMLGINSQQKLVLKGRETASTTHNRFALMDAPGKSALSFFLNPINLALDRVASQYTTIKMIGRSGGGWTTTMYAALDPRISESVSVAGTAPIVARSSESDGRDDLGDWEQYGANIYQWLDYQDLYALAGKGGRRHEQLYFEFDNCCFSGIKGENSRKIYEDAYGVGTTVVFTVVAGHTDHYGMPITLLADKLRN